LATALAMPARCVGAVDQPLWLNTQLPPEPAAGEAPVQASVAWLVWTCWSPAAATGGGRAAHNGRPWVRRGDRCVVPGTARAPDMGDRVSRPVSIGAWAQQKCMAAMPPSVRCRMAAMLNGGHFAALRPPRLFVDDLRGFGACHGRSRRRAPRTRRAAAVARTWCRPRKKEKVPNARLHDLRVRSAIEGIANWAQAIACVQDQVGQRSVGPRLLVRTTRTLLSAMRPVDFGA